MVNASMQNGFIKRKIIFHQKRSYFHQNKNGFQSKKKLSSPKIELFFLLGISFHNVETSILWNKR